ncbi:MAG TPA: hypothetical protein V6D48_08585 [Oculatellaceae cyanobacterium]
MTPLVTVPERIGERTGGQAGYEVLLKQSASSVKSTSIAQQDILVGISRTRLPTSALADAVVQVITEIVEPVLPSDSIGRFELYKALTESLRQKLIGYQQAIKSKTVVTQNSFDDNEDYYEKHESPTVVKAFMKTISSFPLEQGERTPIYTDEELDIF